MAQNLPPGSDDVLERHQFYAATSAQLQTIQEEGSRHRDSMRRVHERLDATNEAFINMQTENGKIETRNKTLGLAVIGVWAAISGIFGWVWDKSSTKIDQYVSKIEQLEKSVNELTRDRAEINNKIAELGSIKRSLETLDGDMRAHRLDNNMHKAEK